MIPHRTSPRRLNAVRAFSLIELIVVVLIIGVLAAIVVIGYSSFTGKSRDSAAAAELQAFASAILAEHTANNALELSRELVLQALATGSPAVTDGLGAEGSAVLLGKDGVPSNSNEFAIGFSKKLGGPVNDERGHYAVLATFGDDALVARAITYGGKAPFELPGDSFDAGTSPADIFDVVEVPEPAPEPEPELPDPGPIMCPAVGEKNPLIIPRPTYHDTVLPHIDPETDPVTVLTVEVEAGELVAIMLPDWSDSRVEWGGPGEDSSTAGWPKFTYNTAGTYQIVIHGSYSYISGLPNGLISVDRWDEKTGVQRLANAFNGLPKLRSVVAPPSTVFDYSHTFANTPLFNADVTGWDVSNVTIFYGTFSGATAFEGKGLETWDVSGIAAGTSHQFSDMFHGATAVNADLTYWDVSGAIMFRSMFADATSFNGDVSCWKPGVAAAYGQVNRFGDVFARATAFEGKGVGNWDISAVRGVVTTSLFEGTSFREDLSGWDATALLADQQASRMFETMPQAWKDNPALHPTGLVYP